MSEIKSIETKGKIYCCTDLHGQYGLWAKIRDYMQPEDTLFFLGDAIDRGPAGLKIMIELFKDKRVIYLPGNHEDSFWDMIKYLMSDLRNWRENAEDFSLWMYNGGYDTLMEWVELPREDKEFIYKELHTLVTEDPDHYIFQRKDGKKVFLSHAGTSIEKSEQDLRLLACGQRPYLWDRRHYKHPWPKQKQWEDWMVIHGHTPVQLLNLQVKEGDPEICVYDDGHKVDLDLGSFSTDKIALYDLETDEVIYFYDKQPDLVP